MICEQCKELGQKSNVYPGGSFSTLMAEHPYYDSDGKYHHHSMNKRTKDFSCSKGHRWAESYYPRCPQGDYP